MLKARPDDETTFVPKAAGSFQRGACNVQEWIEQDGEFPPEANRYHVFVNYGCGWCHQVSALELFTASIISSRNSIPLQVMMVMTLRRLDSISSTHVSCYRVGQRGTPTYGGYAIAPGIDSSGAGVTCMREVYNVGCDGKYGTDQLTIPVLFDKKTKRVVSNDPAQILLMLDFFCEKLGGAGDSGSPCLYPPALQSEIEVANSIVFPGINNGVYCCWFGGAPGDAAYDEAYALVQDALRWLENRLAQNERDGRGPFLCGTTHPTLADVRAFPHVVRFDGIYHDLMMRGRGVRVFGGGGGGGGGSGGAEVPAPAEAPVELPQLARWVREHMFGLPAVRATCDLQVATRFYWSRLPVSESDAVYDVHRARMGGWLPSREEWAAKRRAEGMIEAQAEIPSEPPAV